MLDEADIIEAFVRHTATYIQHHIFLDNGSTDGTLDIVRSLKEEGVPLTVYQNCGVSFSEQSFMRFLYERAVEDQGADWVVCLDCDEFIDDRAVEGGFRRALSEVRSDVPAVKLPWHHYLYMNSDDQSEMIAPKKMTNRMHGEHDNKVIVRGNLTSHDVAIDNGNHEVMIDGVYDQKTQFLSGIYLAHYSERNSYQTIVKFIRGWAKAKAAGKEIRERGVSTHYKGPFEVLRDSPQDLLLNAGFMSGKNEGLEIVEDPIDYRGGPLRYSSNINPAMLAVRSLVGYMEALADRHAELTDAVPEVKEFVERSNRQNVRII